MMRAMLSALGILLLAAGAPPPTSSPGETLVRTITAIVDCVPACPPALLTELTDSARNEVERSAGYRWVDAPQITSEELAVALNCETLDEKCLGRVVGTLQVDAMLWLAVKPAAQTEITVSLFTAERGTQPQHSTLAARERANLTRAVRQVLRRLLGPTKPTRLLVLTDPTAATVLVDGRERGESPLTLVDLGEGLHQVTVKREGIPPRTVEVDLVPGQSTEVRLALTAPAPTSPPPAPPVATREEPARSTSWVGVLLPAAGALTAAAGVLLALAGVGAGSGYGAVYASMYAVSEPTLRAQTRPLTGWIRHRDYVLFQQAQYPLLAVALTLTTVGVVGGVVMLALGALLAAVSRVLP
ncbi:MAG: PEGA domain-containing protein [Myxococcota bacterium]